MCPWPGLKQIKPSHFWQWVWGKPIKLRWNWKGILESNLVLVMEFRCKAWWRWINSNQNCNHCTELKSPFIVFTLGVTDGKISLICRIEKGMIWVQNTCGSILLQCYLSRSDGFAFSFPLKINLNSTQFTWLPRDKSLTWSVSKSWLCYVITSHHRIHSTKHFLWHTDRTRILAVT